MSSNDCSSNYTAFTDCASETIVIRIPYEFCVALIKNAPDTAEKEILLTKIRRCRSNKLKRLLEEHGL